jgi:hypothetical protein
MRLAPLALALLVSVALAGCGKETEVSNRGVQKYGVPSQDLGKSTGGGEVGEATAKAPAPAAAPSPSPAPAAPSPAPAPARPAPAPGGGAYAVIEVKDGGRITGTCKLSKAVDRQTIQVSKEIEQCAEGDHFSSQREVFDPETLGLQNCVVTLTDITKGKAWTGEMAKDDRSAVVDQKHCQYVPHILVVRDETQINVWNSDPTKHNIHGFMNTEQVNQFNFGTAEGVKAENVPEAFLERPAKYILRCDIHPWMNAYIWAVKNPYIAVTDAKGQYTLDDVPPGTYTVECWHEGMKADPIIQNGQIAGYNYQADFSTTKSATVEAGKDVTVDFVVPAP